MSCESCLPSSEEEALPAYERGGGRMRVVLLSLSGDLDCARRELRRLCPESELAEMRRAEVEGAGFKKRLELLRSMKPDVFAVLTERLAWQRGQNQLALFGALAGALKILLFDSHGGMKEESRAV